MTPRPIIDTFLNGYSTKEDFDLATKIRAFSLPLEHEDNLWRLINMLKNLQKGTDPSWFAWGVDIVSPPAHDYDPADEVANARLAALAHLIRSAV